MSREWKPGDVAVIKCLDLDCEQTFHQAILGRAQDWWLLDLGEYMASHDAEPVRPLVVIDPEDKQATLRLAECYLSENPGVYAPVTRVADRLQAALREFANPTPPKPVEPTGLGAVVVDDFGTTWTRVFEASSPEEFTSDRWVSGHARSSYADIDAVKVLSEGVTQ